MTITPETRPDLPWDILTPGNGTNKDDEAMSFTPSYDYVNQEWRHYSDHAHMWTDDSPLVFCGADEATCRKANPEHWN